MAAELVELSWVYRVTRWNKSTKPHPVNSIELVATIRDSGRSGQSLSSRIVGLTQTDQERLFWRPNVGPPHPLGVPS